MDQQHLTPDAREIRRLLPEALASLPIYAYSSIDSTNAEGKRIQLPPPASSALLIAGAQEAGRGRMDRSFYSPAETGLYMTLVYRTACRFESIRGLTPAVAVATAKAIEFLTGQPVSIKWVNDLYQNDRKVGGILVEAMPDGAETRFVIGIGINLTTKAFPDGFRAPAGSLSDTGGAVPSPEALCAAITSRLIDVLATGFSDGFASVLPAYRAHSLLKEGQPILIFRGADGVPVHGTVNGISDDFSLSVTLSDGRVTSLCDGEVSVRVARPSVDK